MNRNVPLPAIATRDSITSTLPADIMAGVEVALPFWTDAPNWDSRALVWDAQARALVADGDWSLFATHATTRLLTAFLEQLGERDIGHIAQALAYRMSSHPAWVAAAQRWLAGAPDDAVTAHWALHPASGIVALNALSVECMS